MVIKRRKKASRIGRMIGMGLIGGALATSSNAKQSNPSFELHERKPKIVLEQKQKRVVDLARDKKQFVAYVNSHKIGKFLGKNFTRVIVNRAYSHGISKEKFLRRIDEEIKFELKKEEILHELNVIFPQISIKAKRQWVEKIIPIHRSHSKRQMIDAFHSLIDELKSNPNLIPRELLDDLERKKDPNKRRRDPPNDGRKIRRA